MNRPRPEILSVEIPSISRPYQEGVLRLDLNEAGFPPSPVALRALRDISERELRFYPDEMEVRKQTAALFGVGEENLLLTLGADDALRKCFFAYVGRGDVVVSLTPSYPRYRYHALLSSARLVEVPLGENFIFPESLLLNSIRLDTKTVVVSTVNNPTGTSLPENMVKKLSARLQRGFVLVDETYYPFNPLTHINLAVESGRVMVLRSFSKTYALAGVRLGCVISDVETIENLRRVTSPFAISGPSLAVLQGALSDVAWTMQIIQAAEEARVYLAARLEQLGFRTFPSQGNFLFVEFGSIAKQVFDGLKRRGIYVNFPKNLKPANYLRIATTQKAQMEILVDTLVQLLPELGFHLGLYPVSARSFVLFSKNHRSLK